MNHSEVNSKPKASAQALHYLIIISLFLLLVTVISLIIDLRSSHRQYEELATVIGRAIYEEVVVVRRWNAEHGGVYVPVTEGFQPNPNLEDTLRDITTTEGMRLTKVNPEYMTRLISELLSRERGVKIHITSLKLISPANKPDLWEEGALKHFEKGSSEEFGVTGSDESMFRYMAPLRVEASCLNCHARQGYMIGNIRGGISVSFSYEPFQKAVSRSYRQIYLVHGFFFLLGLAIIYLLGRKLMVRIVELQKALIRIKRLEGFLPICSSCKRIRMEGGNAKEQASWIPVETYIEDRTDAEFSHGLCPECLKKLYGFKYDT